MCFFFFGSSTVSASAIARSQCPIVCIYVLEKAKKGKAAAKCDLMKIEKITIVYQQRAAASVCAFECKCV